MSKNYWVYILYCENNSFYTGYTNNLVKRYQAHLSGSVKYTRSFKPLYIAQSWCITESKSLAMRIEAYIKKLSKAEKERLVLAPEELKKIFVL